jgi:hypothetical protein
MIITGKLGLAFEGPRLIKNNSRDTRNIQLSVSRDKRIA